MPKRQRKIDKKCSRSSSEKSGTKLADIHSLDGSLKICHRPTEWLLKSFLEDLHSQPCFSFAPDVISLFNSTDLRRNILTEEELTFPEKELKKLEEWRPMSNPTLLKIIHSGQTYYWKKLAGDNGVMIEVVGNTEKLANEAFAALVLAKFFGERKLARYLFENYLIKTSLDRRDKVRLFHTPKLEPSFIENQLYAPQKSREKFIRLEAVQFPGKLTIEEFFVSSCKLLNVCTSEKPGLLAETMELPSQIVLALGDFGVAKCRVERKNFFCQKIGYGLYSFSISKKLEIPKGNIKFKAYSNSRFGAKEACCALVLAQYYGDPATARRLLENLMKGSWAEFILFDKILNLKKSTKKHEAFDPDAGSIDVLTSNSTGCFNVLSLGSKKKDKGFNSRKLPHNVADAFERCKSPLQAVKLLKKSVSLDNFRFVPYKSEVEVGLIYGCMYYDAAEGARFKDEIFSTSAYMALQLCCLKLLNDEKVERTLLYYCLAKFRRIHRKDCKCYGRTALLNCTDESQILELAKTSSTSILKDIELEDEEFERALNERRVLRNSYEDPGSCKLMYKKVRLFSNFLGVQNSFNGKSWKMESQLSVRTKGPPCIFARYDDLALDLDQIRYKLRDNNLDLQLGFHDGQFYVRLVIDGRIQFIESAFVSSGEAFRKAVYRAVQTCEATTFENEESFANIDLCSLVNMATEKLGVSFAVLSSSVHQVAGGQWAAKFNLETKVWKSGPCCEQTGALRALLVAICS